MFSFEDLCSSKHVNTFAYWLLVERKPLPNERFSVDFFRSWMARHYDIEEQAYTASMLRSDQDLIPEFIRLIAPITLAEQWTPFTAATAMLGNPIRAERSYELRSAALGAWEPKDLGSSGPDQKSEHDRHFTFLIRMACSIARRENGRILIFGSPGWDYTYWKNTAFMMNSDTAILMHEAGYLYTDRIAQ